MDSPTVPTTAPDEAHDDRVAEPHSCVSAAGVVTCTERHERAWGA